MSTDLQINKMLLKSRLKMPKQLQIRNDIFINFASTKGSLPVGHPYFFAKKMNERFLQSELEDKYFGRLIFDYATSAVASKVIETNF